VDRKLYPERAVLVTTGKGSSGPEEGRAFVSEKEVGKYKKRSDLLETCSRSKGGVRRSIIASGTRRFREEL